MNTQYKNRITLLRPDVGSPLEEKSDNTTISCGFSHHSPEKELEVATANRLQNEFQRNYSSA